MVHHFKGFVKNHRPVSLAVAVRDLLFVSGLASVDPESGQIVQDTFEGKAQRAFANLQTILASADCSFWDVVNVKDYVRGQENLVRYNGMYTDYFSEPFPSRSTIVNCLPKSLQFEIVQFYIESHNLS